MKETFQNKKKLNKKVKSKKNKTPRVAFVLSLKRGGASGKGGSDQFLFYTIFFFSFHK